MAALIQMCERKFGEMECPFHSENNVGAECNECKNLVCLKCITSKDHQGHTFSELEDTVLRNSNIIRHFIELINSTLLPALRKKMQDFQKEKKATEDLKSELKIILKERYEEIFELLNNGTILEILNTEMQTLNNEIEKLCDYNTAELQERFENMENMEQDMTEFETTLGQVLEEQSPVRIYDTNQKVKQKKESFKLPNMPGLDHIDLTIDHTSAKELVKKTLGKIILSPCKTNESLSISTKIHVIGMIPNIHPVYYSITPITEDTAWCVNKYEEKADKYCITNNLYMINCHNNKGQIQKRLQTSFNIRILCQDPSTGALYGTFDDDTICTIDTSTGTTTTVVRCPYQPCSLTITPGGDIIVGEYWKTHGYVYRYSPDGQLLHQSKEKYKIRDISYSAINDQVAVACGTGGVTVMDGTLTHVLHKYNINCYTAVYDVDGSFIIGDWNEKEICILDGMTLSTIKSFTLPELSHPEEIRLCGSSMWVTCIVPAIIVCVMFQR